MSRIRKQSEYERTFAYRFFHWLGGEKDAFVGNMEMRPQQEYREEEATIQERMKDRQQVNPTQTVHKRKDFKLILNS